MKVRHSKAKGVNVLRQRWCGPAAISALCGVTAERAAKEINRHRGRRPGQIVKGSWPNDLRYAAKQFGFDLVRVPDMVGKSVTQMLKEVDRSKRYLVFTSTHFFALKGNKAYDNTYLLGWSIRRKGARFRRGKLRGLYELRRIMRE